MSGAPAGEDVNVELLEECYEFTNSTTVRCPGVLLLRHNSAIIKNDMSLGNGASAKGVNRKTHHFTLLELSDVLFKDELPLRFDLGLLPDRMLREEFVCCREGRVVEDVRIALEHVADSGTRLGQTSFAFFLLLRLQVVHILET